MSGEQRVVHAVSNDVDLDMAIALALPVVACCGTTFVPKYRGGELDDFPRCLLCRPQRQSSNHGKHRTPVEVRQFFPHYVYRCYDGKDRLLYVGCTYNPPARLRQHKAEAKWYPKVERVRLIVFPNRRKALDMEREAIETEHPLHNRQFSKRNVS